MSPDFIASVWTGVMLGIAVAYVGVGLWIWLSDQNNPPKGA